MRKRIFTATAVLVASACLGLEPWEQLGPNGATVSAMSTVPGFPDEVYLVPEGHPARVMHTSDLGTNWDIYDTIPSRVYDLVVDPTEVSVLYAAGDRGKVYRSVSAGRSWSERGEIPDGGKVRRLTLKPGEPDTMWACTEVTLAGGISGIGAYRSDNGGLDWSGTLADSGFMAKALLLHADSYQTGRLFLGGCVSNTPRLWSSPDGGTTWQDISTGLGGTSVYDIGVCPTDPATLVCVTDAGVYRSANSGANWQQVESAPAYSIEFAPMSPHPAYVGSDNLVFRSDDNGATWMTDTTEFFGTMTRRLEINPNWPLELYAGSGAGVFHSSNGGFSWTELTGGLTCLTVPFVHFPFSGMDTVYACPFGYGIIRSEDRGITWSPVEGFPNAGLSSALAVNPRDPDTVVATTNFDARLYRTTDQGDSWVSFPLQDNFVSRGVCYHPAGPDTLYAWGGKRDSLSGPPRFRLLKSTDRGENWVSLLSRGTNRGMCLGFHPSASGETLFAWGAVDGFRALYRSTTAGNAWTSLSSGIGGSSARDFAMGPVGIDVYFCASPSGVFRTLNQGQAWTDLGLRDVSAVLPDSADQDIILAGTDTAGVYFSDDAGIVWDRDTLDLASREVLDLGRFPGSGVVYCCAAGASILAHGVIGIAEQPRERHPGQLLVRPTLVNGKLDVSLAHPTARGASIDLYRTDGTRACHLASPPAGTRTTEVTLPKGLAGGTYLLVVSSGQERRTAKFVLTK